MSKNNFIGTIKVELNLYDIDNDELSLEIVNHNDDRLITRINDNLKILDIIRNTNKIKMYESIIKDNEKLIFDSIYRKKQDILDVASYMISKEKEILYYKSKIEQLEDINITTSSNCSSSDKIDSPANIIVEHNQQEPLPDISTIITNQCKEYNIKCINEHNTDSTLLYHLKDKELNCIIEIKENMNNIGTNEIKKFINKYISYNSYNCGILISLYSDFTNNSNIKDFDILNINGSPVIFISQLKNNYNKLNDSIKILNSIIEYKLNNNIIDNQAMNIYIQFINKYYDTLENNIDIIDSKILKYNSKIESIQNKLQSLKNKKIKFINDIQNIESINFNKNNITDQSIDLISNHDSINECIMDDALEDNLEDNLEVLSVTSNQ